MNTYLSIENNGTLYLPVIVGDIAYSTHRQGSAGELKFTMLADSAVTFEHGDHVRFKVEGNPVFYGFIFTKKVSKDGVIDVTAYDQLRYFKNKDTYVYENKTASELINMLACDFNMQAGEIEDTGFIISDRTEADTTLFDMVINALGLTLDTKKELYVLYDDFGKLTLKNIASMKIDLLIDADTGENFDYATSIDDSTYNKVKLTYENEETGKREVFITQDGDNINKWGVLQYYEKLQTGENAGEKAGALLDFYNHVTKSLSVSNCFGDTRVRAGCSVALQLDLGDTKVSNWMLVEKCKHVFKEGGHFMDLNLRGGDFIA